MRMKPPVDAVNVTYNGQNVGPDGVEVLERDVADLEAEGWTAAEPTTSTTEE